MICGLPERTSSEASATPPVSAPRIQVSARPARPVRSREPRREARTRGSNSTAAITAAAPAAGPAVNVSDSPPARMPSASSAPARVAVAKFTPLVMR